MATYKVLQDVEAEDKLVGPLTFKQFIFALIAVFFGYMTFLFFQIHVALAAVPLPIALFFGFLAVFRRADQPIEVYLVALLRFWLIPRKRTWSQDGMVSLVNIAVPKKEKPQYAKMSESEAKSRLKNLASLMDSHGWASKHASYQSETNESDRLISLGELPRTPQSQPAMSAAGADDVQDISTSAVAQQFDDMLEKNEQKTKDTVKRMMRAETQQPDTIAKKAGAPSKIDQTNDNEQPKYNPYPEMRQKVITTTSDTKKSQEKQKNTSTMTEKVTPDILNSLAHRDDLTVGTVAHEAKQILKDDEEISLH